jgi:Subtilase family
MSDRSRKFPHIYLPDNGKSENYTGRGGGKSPPPPERNRIEHAQFLEQTIGLAIQDARKQLDSRQPDIAAGIPGFYLEFQILADKANAFQQLGDRRKNIELVAVKKIPEQEGMVSATVFVPEIAADYFLNKVRKYRNENDKKSGKPKNERLVSRIESVHVGKVTSLFTDDPSLFPANGLDVWWEVWLRKDRRSVFDQVVQFLNIRTKHHAITFPEREIVLVMSNIEAMTRIIANSDAVAELRIAKDIPSIFLEMGSREQLDWVEDLARRLIEPGKHAVAISLLDSGATRTHPLLALGLASDDMHTVEPSWGTNDSPYRRGHGTAMAGIALYADYMLDNLATDEPVKLLHRIESVKILPTIGENDPELYGAITEQGVFLPEIQAPHRRRVFCMAVTSNVGSNDCGTPSSWSAAIDKLCFNDNEFPRLMIISVGNIPQDVLPSDYLNINDLATVENPAQAWNALIVGAYTEKVNILDPKYNGWQPLAPGGDLSPRSRTSVSWETQWPIRPDVVFEGGNMAHDGENLAEAIDDLCLLTTHYRPEVRMFDYMGDTSSATALASHMAARIMSEQPTYRLETVRAMIVHSAEWTPAMQTRFGGTSTKTAKRSLVRRYGYGVPDLARALQSASNDLTLVIEDELQPFYKGEGKNYIQIKDMKLHKLPWPIEELEKLGEANVELKVTLSYFIEPNPGERGWKSSHRYASHGLRFKVKSSLETTKDFKYRINKAVREEEDGVIDASSSPDKEEEKKWFLGPMTRDGGSLHSDIWFGNAVELASKDAIAVYPVGGWWKEKKYLERYNEVSHYSLIVSIRVPGVDVDIYTPVANLVSISVPMDIAI